MYSRVRTPQTGLGLCTKLVRLNLHVFPHPAYMYIVHVAQVSLYSLLVSVVYLLHARPVPTPQHRAGGNRDMTLVSLEDWPVTSWSVCQARDHLTQYFDVTTDDRSWHLPTSESASLINWSTCGMLEDMHKQSTSLAMKFEYFPEVTCTLYFGSLLMRGCEPNPNPLKIIMYFK